MAFSMAAEIERDLISQRTKEALRFKKAQGIKLGRPTGPGKSKLDPYRPQIESLLANGSTQKFIARRYHTTEANLHNWLKKHGLKLSKEELRGLALSSPRAVPARLQSIGYWISKGYGDFSGIVYRSARRRAGHNIVIFAGRVTGTDFVVPISRAPTKGWP
jgi:hypothetical protein